MIHIPPALKETAKPSAAESDLKVRAGEKAIYLARYLDVIDITTRAEAEEVIAACEVFLRGKT